MFFVRNRLNMNANRKRGTLEFRMGHCRNSTVIGAVIPNAHGPARIYNGSLSNPAVRHEATVLDGAKVAS
jgi:hypothetical protein